MVNMNRSTSIAPSDSLEPKATYMVNSNMDMHQTPVNHHNLNSSYGPVAILWDIENCPVPSDVRPEDVGGNIRMALRVHPVITGAVMMFSAYGDFNAFPRRLREGCQRTGVKLVDVPNGRKDAADKAILVDMFLFALDNRPPSSIMLISGDVDFAPALHILGQRGYTVILVIPSGVGVSSALYNAGKFVWDWPSVARGEGFVPPIKTLMPRHVGLADVAGKFMGCDINDNSDAQNEEAIVYRGISQSYYNFSILSQSLSEYTSTSPMNLPCFPSNLRSQSLPSGFDEVSAGQVFYGDQNDSIIWVQPGDINGLRTQMVRLLELSGGCLPLTCVPTEYKKLFGRPLYVSEYGANKLVNLFKKMGDMMTVEGSGQRKFVCLKNSKTGPAAHLARKDKRGKCTQEENLKAGAASSDELSDDERVVVEENDEGNNQGKLIGQTEIENLRQFKHELEEILVSYSCRIFLGCFESIYQQRYKRPLDFRRFGVDQLEDLFEKVQDVVVLHEEPMTQKKFLAAGG